MSFSDFGRTAMAALSPTATQRPPSGVSKSRNSRRSSDPLHSRRSHVGDKDGRRRTKSSRDVGREDPKPPLKSSHRRRSDGGAIIGHKASKKNSMEIHRGVRPQLNHIKCPVTEKTLMDDVLTVQSGDDGYVDASLASTSISSSTTNHDQSYDDDSVDDYSDSDIGLNQSSSEHKNRRNKSSNSHSNTGFINGRKSEWLEQKPGFDTPQQRRRRLPKHYNNVSEPKSDHDRHMKRANQRRDSRSSSKVSEKGKSKSINNQNLKSASASASASASSSTKLSTEISQFQKMVANLEDLSRSSVSSPEAMWKSRILLRSARDAERDLKLALEKEEQEAVTERGISSVAVAVKKASQKKMKRDYYRASEQFQTIVEEIERRQQAEISCLTASEAAVSGVNPEGAAAAASQKRAMMGAAQAEEDFFDRAMRERQTEVQKISDGMKKVQEIYTDLAGLVDDQQDQIDRLEDINDDVKADTRAGLEEIQHGMWKLCAADQQKIDGIDRTSDRKRKENVLNPSDIFNCMMACHGDPKSQGGVGILSLDDNLYPEKTNISNQLKDNSANYYSDDVPPPESAWTLPNLEDVQESAQDAFERGHAMVGGLVDQVHEVVTSGEGLPIQLRDVGNRISCTPQPEEYSYSEYSDFHVSNEMRSDESNFTNENYEDNSNQEEEPIVDENHRRQHRSEGERQPSLSRQRSRSHSKRRQKHENLQREHRREEWEEDEDRQYNKTKGNTERQRRKGRKSSISR